MKTDEAVFPRVHPAGEAASSLFSTFTGSCEVLCPVDTSRITEWLSTIPFEEWPQQNRLPDKRLRPAMVTDLAWHGFGAVAAPLIVELLKHFPGAWAHQRMLSVIMPGHNIDPHRDEQEPGWVCRVHIPLVTNPRSWFIINGERHNLDAGFAYRFNTRAEHAVFNDGDDPRVHFMFDVRTGACR